MKRNQCYSLQPPQNLIAILQNHNLLGKYSSLHFNYNYILPISLDCLKELRIYVKSRWEYFAYAIEFLHVSMKLEPRRPHVLMRDLQRIKPENISHQKSDWKFENSISFHWRDIRKAIYLQSIAVIDIFFQISQFSPKGKDLRPWFCRGLLRTSKYASKIFYQ